jgi:hypothetical protein
MMGKTHIIVAILMMAIGPTIAPTLSVCSADETLIGHWAFEEGNGADAKDLSDFGNDGVIKGETEWNQGKIGTALAFFKEGQGYVEIIDNETLDISEQITMSAWIKPTEIYIGDVWQERNCVVAKVRAYYLDISENGNLASYLYGVQPQEWLVGETDMTQFLNTWVHVATVYDGKEHKLYVNGDLDASVGKSGAITVNDENLAIGWVDNNRYFDGLIDEVSIWSRGLTEEELAGLLSVEPEDKLATCWGDIKWQGNSY